MDNHTDGDDVDDPNLETINMISHSIPYLDVASILNFRMTCSGAYRLTSLSLPQLDFSHFKAYEPKVLTQVSILIFYYISVRCPPNGRNS